MGRVKDISGSRVAAIKALRGHCDVPKTSLFKWDVPSLLCPTSWQKNNPTGKIVAGKWKSPGEMKERWRGPPPRTGLQAQMRSANCGIYLVPRFPSPPPLSADSILLDTRARFLWPSHSSTPSRRDVWIGPELVAHHGCTLEQWKKVVFSDWVAILFVLWKQRLQSMETT